MENKEDENRTKASDNQEYDTNNPQNLNIPKYNSTSAHRDGNELPAVENLNQIKGLKNELKGVNNDDLDSGTPKNDESLYGENVKTDLGGGQRDEDEDEAEKIIRT